MIELIVKMIVCLVVAIILGFIFGWLLSQVRSKKKYLLEVKNLEKILFDRDISLKEAQGTYKDEQMNGKKMALKNTNVTTQLLEKSKELEEQSMVLKKIKKELEFQKNNLNKKVDTQENREGLAQKVLELESLLEQSNIESQGLENVLVRADSLIEEHNNTIKVLEKKLFSCQENENNQEEEFVITKDQFTQIESQLVEYQEEIKRLTELNKRVK